MSSQIEETVLLVVKQLNGKPFPIHPKTRNTEIIKRLERGGKIKVSKIVVDGEEKFYLSKS